MKTKDGIKIYLSEIEERHDSGWAEWNCDIEMADGTSLAGCSVQSDGHLFARETLKDSNGNEI